MAMTNEQLDSIGAFLRTNPSQEALSAAMQQFGVGQGDLDAARSRMDGGGFTVGGGGKTANSQQLTTDRMQQMAQAGKGVKWGNGQSEAGMIEQARSQGWSPQYMAQAMGVPVDQISGAFQNYDLGVGREKDLATRSAMGTDVSASPWGGFSPASAAQAQAPAQAQSSAATPATAKNPFAVGGAASSPTPNLGMGNGKPPAPIQTGGYDNFFAQQGNAASRFGGGGGFGIGGFSGQPQAAQGGGFGMQMPFNPNNGMSMGDPYANAKPMPKPGMSDSGGGMNFPAVMPAESYFPMQPDVGVGMGMPFDPNAGIQIEKPMQVGGGVGMQMPFNPNEGMSLGSDWQANSADPYANAQPMPKPVMTDSAGGYNNPTIGQSAQGPNPYLDQMASGITSQVQQNFLQQIAPQLRSGAQAAGQYGGSRQGIAEGVAAGNAATGLAGQLANLYGGAYNTDQANQTQRYGTNVGANVSVRGQDVSQNIAGMNNQTNMRGQDQTYALGRMGNQTTQRGQNINQNIANMGNATTQRGQDQNYALGQMGNQTTQRGQNINQNIANMGNATTQRGQDQNYRLGQGNLGLGYQNSSNSYNLGVMGNQTTQRGQDQNYNLGQGQLGLGYQNAANNYNLGLGQLDLSNQGQNQNFYTSQRGQDLQQYQIGANLYGSGVNGQTGVGQGQYNVGQQYQNAPINAVNQYGQAISPYTGYGQTQTTSGQAGGGANGVIGGGLAGAQVANNMWRGSQGNQAMINGGGFSNFPAYMYQGN